MILGSSGVMVGKLSSSVPSVLFVDDEPLSRKYFAASIAPFAEVFTAGSPHEAKQILAKHHSQISVVVSDERMPLESGIPFLVEVRREWPNTRRVLTSAYADFDRLHQAINYAAIHHFVPKPWDFDELCIVVRQALRAEGTSQVLDLDGTTRSNDPEHDGTMTLLDEQFELIEKESVQLLGLACAVRGVSLPNSSLASGNWSTQRVLGQIAVAAVKIQKAVTDCRSIRTLALEKPGKLKH